VKKKEAGPNALTGLGSGQERAREPDRTLKKVAMARGKKNVKKGVGKVSIKSGHPKVGPEKITGEVKTPRGKTHRRKKGHPRQGGKGVSPSGADRFTKKLTRKTYARKVNRTEKGREEREKARTTASKKS